jgi:hypothetical protein
MPALPGRRRSPLPGAAPIAAADAWRLRDVSWRTVWRRQDHASLLLTLLVAVAVVVIYVAVGPREEQARQRIDAGTQSAPPHAFSHPSDLPTPPHSPQFFLYDATLSYPPSGEHGFDPTVPSVVAILAPLVMWLGTLVVGEFIYSKREHHSVTDAVAVALYFILDAVGSLAVTLLVTQATKVSVARLRPDFLARCQPQNAPSTIELEYGQDTAAMYPCTSPDSSAVQVGSAASLAGQSRQKTPWKPINKQTTNHRPLPKIKLHRTGGSRFPRAMRRTGDQCFLTCNTPPCSRLY